MPDATISLEDRQAIYDTLARYVWSMDTGDIEGVVATFTPDGVVKDITGKKWAGLAPGAPGDLPRISSRVPTGAVGSITSSTCLSRTLRAEATASPRTGSPYNGTPQVTRKAFVPW